MTVQERRRLTDLMTDRATSGLTPGEQRELTSLAVRHPAVADDLSFDLAAAAVDQAFAGASQNVEPLPETLRHALQEQGARWCRDGRASDEVVRFPRAVEPLEDEAPVSKPNRPAVVRQPDRAAPQARGGGLGWWVAAAAILIGLLGWFRPQPAVELPVELSLAEQRDLLIADAPDLVQWDWTATEDEAALFAGGSVVWSADRDQGYMVFSKLQPNDADEFQYQLWIFDRARDERYPVDGGVFDMPAGEDEVIVPIDPKVGVDEAYLFAITVEPPGGVVVSNRERIVLLAQAPEQV